MMIRTTMLLLMAGTLGLAQDADSPPVFRMEVSLINVDAKVTTRNGTDIPNLKAADFQVFDEDQSQPVTHFGRETTPIDLLLVLDTSRSARPFLLQLTPQVSQALSPLREGDRAGVLLFASRSEVVQPLTDDLTLVPRTTVNTIYKDGRGSGVLLSDALVSGARYLRSQPAHGRRTIVVLTTGDATSGAVPDDEVIRELYAADAVANIIVLGATDVQTKVVRGYHAGADRTPDIHRIAEATGGGVVTADDPASALRHVIAETTTRYTLQYAPPAGEPGAFRRIRVALSGAASARYPGAVVKAREGYQVPKP